MSENRPQGPGPRLGTPQIKTGPRRPADEPAAEASLPTRRSLRQHRRADSAAGAPAGELSKATILELPAAIISPSDVGPLTGQLPRVIYSVRDDAGGGYAIKSPEPRDTAEPVEVPGQPAGVRVDHDGVPVGADGHPLTRRELREWRRRHEAAPTDSSGPAGQAAPAGQQHQSRRAEAPAGSPGTAAEPPTRASLAAEGAALAARIEASGGGDPAAVDPRLLREQELLAERARQLNTGLITRVPAPSPAQEPAPAPAAPAAPAAPGPRSPAAAQEPVQAESAHGLDSLGASAWSSRERNLMLLAGTVILALLIALLLALVL
ncbi:hypothetical protein F7P69_27195 [Cellulosimicrobium funkei]|nr:hypothetical protein [Cellulosimicrobium funkei]